MSCVCVCRHFFVSLKKKKNPFSFNPRRANLKERGGGGVQWNVLKTPLQRFLWVSFSLPFGCHLLISPSPDGSAELPPPKKKFGEKMEVCTQQHFVS